MSENSSDQRGQPPRIGEKWLTLVLQLLILVALAAHGCRLHNKSSATGKSLAKRYAQGGILYTLSNTMIAVNARAPTRLRQIPIRSEAGANSNTTSCSPAGKTTPRQM